MIRASSGIAAVFATTLCQTTEESVQGQLSSDRSCRGGGRARKGRKMKAALMDDFSAPAWRSIRSRIIFVTDLGAHSGASSSSSAHAVRGFGTGCGNGPRCFARASGLLRSNQPWHSAQRAKLSASKARAWVSQFRRSDMSGSRAERTTRLLTVEIQRTRPGRLAFQPCFGFGQSGQPPCQLTRLSAV
jgi:hypothetical protein